MNLLGSVNLPILFLDQNLRIRRFNPMAKEVLRLIPTDVGRPIGDIKIGLDIEDFESLLRETLDHLKIQTLEVLDHRGRWYLLQIRPYKTAANKIEGLVLTLADIDALKRSLREVEEAGNYAQAIIETLREPLVVLDCDLRVVSANQSFYDFFKVVPQETEKRLVYELGGHQWDIPALRTLLEEVLPKNALLQDFTVDAAFPLIGHRTMLLNARQIKGDADPCPNLILLALEDITARRAMEVALQESERKLQTLNAELMNAQECERQAVSLTLHEEFAQNLVAMKMKLRPLEAALAPDRQEAKEELRSALQSIDALVEGLRELYWGLRPQVLELGLIPALQHLLNQFQQYFRIDADFQVSGLDGFFAPETQVIIYRVLQEALVNVVKHAQATRVSVKIGKPDGRVQFQVADNGVGFQEDRCIGVDVGKKLQPSPDQAWLVGGVPFQVTEDGKGFKAVPEALGVESGTKMGLLLMESRVRLLGGSLTITSEAGAGTSIAFTVPVDKGLGLGVASLTSPS